MPELRYNPLLHTGLSEGVPFEPIVLAPVPSFAQLDANGDGVITQAEYDQYAAASGSTSSMGGLSPIKTGSDSLMDLTYEQHTQRVQSIVNASLEARL